MTTQWIFSQLLSHTRYFLPTALILLLACGGTPSEKARPVAITLIDDTGYEVRLERVPERIVAHAPSLAEIVAVLGRDTALVGVSAYTDFPPHLSSLPQTGGYASPNIEQIVALRPELVLMIADGPPMESITRLRALGVPVAVFRFQRVAEVLSNIRRIGALIGAQDEGESVATRIERRYAAVKSAVANRPSRRVLYAIAIEPVVTPGGASFIHELLVDAGGANIAGKINAPYPRMTLENVIAEAPECILFSKGMGGEATSSAQRSFWKRWPVIPAVRDNRLVEIEDDLINRPGPRIAVALAEIALAIHPERRAEIEKALRDGNYLGGQTTNEH